jgi:hypothetical protein
MNLPSDLQRLLPYIAVAVLAVVGLVLVMRGVATSGDGGGTTVPAQIDRGGDIRGDGNPAGRSGGTGSNRDGSTRGGERAPRKRSAQAYVNCVQQATNAVALEKCQPLLP